MTEIHPLDYLSATHDAALEEATAGVDSMWQQRQNAEACTIAADFLPFLTGSASQADYEERKALTTGSLRERLSLRFSEAEVEPLTRTALSYLDQMTASAVQSAEQQRAEAQAQRVAAAQAQAAAVAVSAALEAERALEFTAGMRRHMDATMYEQGFTDEVLGQRDAALAEMVSPYARGAQAAQGLVASGLASKTSLTGTLRLPTAGPLDRSVIFTSLLQFPEFGALTSQEGSLIISDVLEDWEYAASTGATDMNAFVQSWVDTHGLPPSPKFPMGKPPAGHMRMPLEGPAGYYDQPFSPPSGPVASRHVATAWETAHNGNPASRIGSDGLYYNHNGEPRSAECTGNGLGCDGSDCSCTCHSPHAPNFASWQDVVAYHTPTAFEQEREKKGRKIAGDGHSTEVMRIPDCDIHKYTKGTPGVPATHDGKTQMGPWANMCDECFHEYGTGTGLGRGQRLVLKQGGFRDFMDEKSGKTAECRYCGEHISESAGGGWEKTSGGTGSDICLSNKGTSRQYGGEHRPKPSTVKSADRTGPTIDSAEGYEYEPAPDWVQKACRARFEGGGETAMDPNNPGHYLHGVGNWWDGPHEVKDNGDHTLSFTNPYDGRTDRFDEHGYYRPDGTYVNRAEERRMEYGGSRTAAFGDSSGYKPGDRVEDKATGRKGTVEHDDQGMASGTGKVLVKWDDAQSGDGPSSKEWKHTDTSKPGAGEVKKSDDDDKGGNPFAKKDASLHEARVQQVVYQAPSHDRDFSVDGPDAATLTGLIGKFCEIVFYNEHGVATDYETGRITQVDEKGERSTPGLIMSGLVQFWWKREGMVLGEYDNPDDFPVLADDVYRITRLEEPTDAGQTSLFAAKMTTKTAEGPGNAAAREDGRAAGQQDYAAGKPFNIDGLNEWVGDGAVEGYIQGWRDAGGTVPNDVYASLRTAAKTSGIVWGGDTHMGVDYLTGIAPNGDQYEAYFNPNMNPLPCTWVNYGPEGDTGPNSGIAHGAQFATMAEAVADAEAHASGGVTAGHKTADAVQRAVQQGMMIGEPEFTHPDAMLPGFAYVVTEPGPNGATWSSTSRRTTDRDEANRWAEELLARTDWSPYTKEAKTASDDDDGPCCYAFVTSGGQFHEPGCPVGDRLPDPGHTMRPTSAKHRASHVLVHEAFLKGAPFAGYEDFAACVKANSDKDDPEAYCGSIKHKVEDSKTSSRTARSDSVSEHRYTYGDDTPASAGHTQPMTFECQTCHHRFEGKAPKACPNCGAPSTSHKVVGSIGASRTATYAGDGEQVRWTIYAGDSALVTGKADTTEQAQQVVARYFEIQPEPIAVKAMIAQHGATADTGFLWHLLPVGLSIESAFFSPDSVAPVRGAEDGPKAITVDHARHQQARINESNQTLEERGTPTIAPTEPIKANEVTSAVTPSPLVTDEDHEHEDWLDRLIDRRSEHVSDLNAPTVATVKRAVNEQAFGSERYQTLNQTFPATGWAGSDGFNADHGPAAHNREIPDQRITGWPSAWGQGSPLAPSEGSVHMAKQCPRCHGTGYVKVEKGKGYDGAPTQVGEKNCPRCHGSGKVASLHTGSWIDQARQVVDSHQYQEVDGILLDATTASMLVQIHDALGAEQKAKFEAMPLDKAADLGWKLVSRTKASKQAAVFPTDDNGSLDNNPMDGDGAPAAPSVPMSTRPQVTPSSGGSSGAGDLGATQQDAGAAVPAPVTPSTFEQPTMAQRREAKIARMAAQIVTDNPGMQRADADRLARMTVAQFPGVVAGG